MKHKTYYNVLRAAKLIRAKGYNEKESYEMAIRCFDNAEHSKNGMSIEWWIDRIVDKEIYVSENQLYVERNPA